MGDLYDERKEGTQNQISAYAMGSADYHARDLADVHPGMQHGNTRLLSSYYLSYDGKLGHLIKLLEKNVTFDTDAGT